jgi:hypothetical protein
MQSTIHCTACKCARIICWAVDRTLYPLSSMDCCGRHCLGSCVNVSVLRKFDDVLDVERLVVFSK